MGFPRVPGSAPLISSPLISVVVPCFNAAPFITAAIGSALGQSHPDLEVIVVDDGSADDSLAVIAGIDDPRLSVIAQENRGASAARNAGLARARGAFVAFLDGDDLLRRDALRIGLDLLRRHPEASFCFGRPEVIDAEGRPMAGPPTPRPEQGRHDYVTALGPRIPVPSALCLFRTDLVRRIGGWDPRFRYAEDYDFYLRNLRHGPAWRHGETVAGYRRHGTNASHRRAACLRDVMALLETQMPLAAGDPVLAAALRAGRRDWQRHFGRLIPREVLGALRDGRFAAAGQALATFAAHAPGTLEGLAGLRRQAPAIPAPAADPLPREIGAMSSGSG